MLLSLILSAYNLAFFFSKLFRVKNLIQRCEQKSFVAFDLASNLHMSLNLPTAVILVMCKMDLKRTEIFQPVTFFAKRRIIH